MFKLASSSLSKSKACLNFYRNFKYLNSISFKPLSTNPANLYYDEKDSYLNHSVGQFHKLSKDTFNYLFDFHGFEPYQAELFQVLDDYSIMVRQPFLQIVKLLNLTDYDRPVNRYVLCKFYF